MSNGASSTHFPTSLPPPPPELATSSTPSTPSTEIAAPLLAPLGDRRLAAVLPSEVLVWGTDRAKGLAPSAGAGDVGLDEAENRALGGRPVRAGIGPGAGVLVDGGLVRVVDVGAPQLVGLGRGREVVGVALFEERALPLLPVRVAVADGVDADGARRGGWSAIRRWPSSVVPRR